jgi:omega-amidase
MQKELIVALIQTDLVWEKPVRNRDSLAKKIHGINEAVDLIVLPEMFSTGFTMNPSTVAETMQGDTVRWMKYIAANKGTAVVGSIVISEDDRFYNRLLFVRSSGELQYYDKRHTFTLAGEHKIYASGTEKLIVNYKGWKVCPLICYDLRFPVWARNVEHYDTLIYVANWPKPRINAWDTLLKARAIENMSYCIGVNRVGLDVNDYSYPGHSAVYDGLGEEISEFRENEEKVEIVTLSKSHLTSVREKLKFLDDKDDFIVK